MQMAQGAPGAIVPLVAVGLFPMAGRALGSTGTSMVIWRGNFPPPSKTWTRRKDLFHGDDDEGEVVLEGAAAEGGDLFADGGEEIGGGEGDMAFSEIDEAGFAEFLVAGVHGFGEAVGEEDEAIAGLEAGLGIGVDAAGHDAERSAALFQSDDSAGGAQEQRRAVAGAGVEQCAGVGVDGAVAEGDEFVGGDVVAKDSVEFSAEGGG